MCTHTSGAIARARDLRTLVRPQRAQALEKGAITEMLDDSTGFLEFTRRRQHSAGRFLEADLWTILAIEPGRLSVTCHLPEAVRNLGGFLFGGFTPTYVDYTAIWTCMTAIDGDLPFLTTVSMKIDYL